MASSEWLASLKPGDKVAVGGGHYGYRIATVSRVTDTRVVVEASNYRRSDGYRCGRSPWNVGSIDPVDAPHVVADFAKQRRRLLRSEIETAAQKATTAALESALAILKASHPADATVPS